jgi:hypothetical protein
MEDKTNIYILNIKLLTVQENNPFKRRENFKFITSMYINVIFIFLKHNEI